MRSAAAAWTRVVRAQRQSGGVGCRSGADARPGTLCSGLGATRGIHRAIDNAYNSLARLNGSFFAQGWGDLDMFYSQERARWDWTYDFMPPPHPPSQPTAVEAEAWPPPPLKLEWRRVASAFAGCRLYEAEFPTVVPRAVHDALPQESRTARAQLMVPSNVLHDDNLECVLYLPGTGDHGFTLRRNLAHGLLKRGVAAVILEGPFYGRRRPPLQPGAKLRHVTDLLLLGRTTIEESRALLEWMRLQGFSNLGISGMSMGGVHAAMVGALHPHPLAVTPIMAPHSAVPVYCDTMLSLATAWDTLADLQPPTTSSPIISPISPISSPTSPASPASASAAAAAAAATTPHAPSARTERIEAARAQMRHVLGVFTDITRLPVPRCPQAAVIVAGTHDAYIPPYSPLAVHHAWPGSEMRWVAGGHISSFLLHQEAFRTAVVDALRRVPADWLRHWEQPQPRSSTSASTSAAAAAAVAPDADR